MISVHSFAGTQQRLFSFSFFSFHLPTSFNINLYFSTAVKLPTNKMCFVSSFADLSNVLLAVFSSLVHLFVVFVGAAAAVWC